ncbi:hypothetical protein WEB32_07535 [Streptomyces netropsis]|uniref:Uncharacterized protein n=1 Tax=Streptomyces netropsis TaxID=55404 RepID=A0A7W7LBG1_STRNE|nr:hypothetical protein [Streptomyces netropsis]MBB4886571.1 hypothetical protein [Streptomyces netropsis]GGR21132.1 hypothetical protein GCM10010219_27630 [Streptomyces netropsis]
MKRVRIALTSVAAAALVLTAAAGASAEDPYWTLSTSDPTQRGREAEFVVTIEEATLDDDKGYVTLESPAFVEPVKLKAEEFREGKDGTPRAAGRGMVLCDIKPGTYPVELKDHGQGEAVDTVDLTVVAEMDPGNREFCAGPKDYDEVKDKTSESALGAEDDEDEDEEDGFGVGTVVGVGAGAAVLAAAGAYALARRRHRAGPGGSGPDASV